MKVHACEPTERNMRTHNWNFTFKASSPVNFHVKSCENGTEKTAWHPTITASNAYHIWSWDVEKCLSLVLLLSLSHSTDTREIIAKSFRLFFQFFGGTRTVFQAMRLNFKIYMSCSTTVLDSYWWHFNAMIWIFNEIFRTKQRTKRIM